jgi:hypothetical protein
MRLKLRHYPDLQEIAKKALFAFANIGMVANFKFGYSSQRHCG